jgi:hypothetical protein
MATRENASELKAWSYTEHPNGSIELPNGASIWFDPSANKWIVFAGADLPGVEPGGRVGSRRDKEAALAHAAQLKCVPLPAAPSSVELSSRAPGSTVRDEEYVPVGPPPEMRRNFFETYRPPPPERPWAETYWERTTARQREAFNAVYGRQMRR